MLQDTGADLSHVDHFGRTPAREAAGYGPDGALRILPGAWFARSLDWLRRLRSEAAGAGLREAAGTGRRPLHGGGEGMVEMGVEVDAEDGEGRTALTVALAFGQEGAARALLKAGAGVNAGTGRRPFHAAAERGMVVMVRELVEKSAEVDAEDAEILVLVQE
ncbi:hypothetical protein CYMTET_29296 [Cymbomonas tetramitiformis]|uniref:Uncharacterized protein n=1 Tax=Cymbomonas tetramitiformis TaxID=36881 RepID=A0AAE0KVA6_9CHLO|nr:hypothetical protein CYMTET_29296 [Cymbomonas tetramitiformis]